MEICPPGEQRGPRDDAITTLREGEGLRLPPLRVPGGARGGLLVTLRATNAFLMNPRLMELSFFFSSPFFSGYELCKCARARLTF